MTNAQGPFSVAEALARMLAEIRVLEPEVVPIERALGRVLAEDLSASHDLPPFPNSAMDGYAVRASDVAGAASDRPVSLRVIGEAAAGAARLPVVGPGAAVRITTGAPIPPGADAVVPVEDTDDARASPGFPPPDSIRIYQPASAGAFIRPIGEDLRAGQMALAAGTLVRPAEIGVLAALGRPEARVVRAPRVAILSTGDELAPPGQPLGPGQIRDSNGYALAALVTRYGAQPIRLGVARDRAEEVRARLLAGLEQGADLILSSAGVSVGAFDVVKDVVRAEGSLDFWRVRMRPGKPVAFGRLRGVPFLGLPGNPVSAIVSFEVFARPAVLKMAGRRNLVKPTVQAVLAEAVRSDGRETYVRAVVRRERGGYVAASAGGQGSAVLSALANSNALVIIPEGVREVAAGETVTAWMLDWPEEVF